VLLLLVACRGWASPTTTPSAAEREWRGLLLAIAIPARTHAPILVNRDGRRYGIETAAPYASWWLCVGGVGGGGGGGELLSPISARLSLAGGVARMLGGR